MLNLYLIKKANYQKPAISLDALKMSWELFLLSYENKKNTYVYVNPPFEAWLDTKNNWCKKVATNLSRKFKMDFDEAVSNVYLSISKLYDKGTVYMGSLNYIQQSIYNDILMDIRYNKNRVNADSGLAISLNTPIGYDADGKEITIEDTLAEPEDISEDSLEYQSTLNCCKKLMADRFSPREIDQIHFALVESFGCILVRMGPVASAANTLTLPPPIEGRMAMVKNTIPKPPIHCDKERQNRMP